MSERLRYDDLLHNCDRPRVDHLPSYGERGQVIARWRCPECRQRWMYAAEFLHHERFYWRRSGRPSRRWHKAEALRLAAEPTP